jgi:hypothetical protein
MECSLYVKLKVLNGLHGAFHINFTETQRWGQLLKDMKELKMIVSLEQTRKLEKAVCGLLS